MKTKCKECGKEIDLVIEDGFHHNGLGNLCKDCYFRWIGE